MKIMQNYERSFHDEVRIVPYREEWPQRFRAAKEWMVMLFHKRKLLIYILPSKTDIIEDLLVKIPYMNSRCSYHGNALYSLRDGLILIIDIYALI